MVYAHMLSGYHNLWLEIRQNCLVRCLECCIASSMGIGSVWFTRVEIGVGWMQDGRKLGVGTLCEFGYREVAADTTLIHTEHRRAFSDTSDLHSASLAFTGQRHLENQKDESLWTSGSF